MFCGYSVAQSCLTFCDSMKYSMPGFPVLHYLLEFAQIHVQLDVHDIKSVMPSICLILCRPLLLLPSIFPSIRVFSNESVLYIRWPKYWNFSFSINPSNAYSELSSFRIDWFDVFAGQGTLKNLLPTPQFESINSLALSFIYSPTLTSIHDDFVLFCFVLLIKP